MTPIAESYDPWAIGRTRFKSAPVECYRARPSGCASGIESSKNPIHIFIKFTIAAVVLWILYLVIVPHFFRQPPSVPEESPWPVRGQFGDMFGAMTCLFSAMTLAGLIATIIHQGDQAQQQQETQRRTDEALARQAESLRLSAEINAVNYRLARYDVQLKGIEGGTREDPIPQYDGTTEERGHLADRLHTERHKLTQRLDALLRKAASTAEQGLST